MLKKPLRHQPADALVTYGPLTVDNMPAAEEFLAAHATIPVERSFLRALAYTGHLAVGAWRDGQLAGVVVGWRTADGEVWSQTTAADDDHRVKIVLSLASALWAWRGAEGSPRGALG